MNIDSSVIFKKAVAREERLKGFIDALDALDNIEAKLNEASRSLQMLFSLYQLLDDEAKSLLPDAVRAQCPWLEFHIRRINDCVDAGENVGSHTISKLRRAIKES